MAELNGIFSVLDSSSNTYYTASGLTAGTTYEFKIEARNQYDFSVYSDTITLYCAYIPEIPTSVTTEIDGSQVKVLWSLPSDNGSPITAYKVYIKEIGTETYTLENTDCDGTQASVISNQYCHIDISTLIASFNLDGGDSVYAKVVAVNSYGETDQSVAGNGAMHTRIPDAPILSEDITHRTSTTDGLSWVDGANNGGVPIIDYRINMR
jgi:hypothetical protein